MKFISPFEGVLVLNGLHGSYSEICFIFINKHFLLNLLTSSKHVDTFWNLWALGQGLRCMITNPRRGVGDSYSLGKMCCFYKTILLIPGYLATNDEQRSHYPNCEFHGSIYIEAGFCRWDGALSSFLWICFISLKLCMTSEHKATKLGTY